jgi:hypothetical protein
VGGEERRFATEVCCDELAALVIDASGGGACDVRRGGVRVGGAVREGLVREDLNDCGEGSVGNGSDVDSRDNDLDSAVVAGHLRLVLGVANRGQGEAQNCRAATEAAHENLRVFMRIAQSWYREGEIFVRE